MTLIAQISQIVIALGIFNVWILRRDRETVYRPHGASNIREEFERYGLPTWAYLAVGTAKLALAVLLLVGLAYPRLAAPAAAAMALLMIGAVGAHLRVGDPLKKAMPATAMLALSSIVVLGQWP